MAAPGAAGRRRRWGSGRLHLRRTVQWGAAAAAAAAGCTLAQGCCSRSDGAHTVLALPSGGPIGKGNIHNLQLFTSRSINFWS